MPLIKGAKPGTKSFGKNIAAEIKAGKPKAQAAAIAYSEAGEKKRVTKKKRWQFADRELILNQ